MYLICSKTPDTLELTDDTVKDLLYAPYSRNWDKMMPKGIRITKCTRLVLRLIG